MKSLLAVLLAAGLVGCGSVTFRGAIRSDQAVFTISGFVSIVQITTIPAKNGTEVVTVVTFLPQFGPASTISFCGNLGNQFFLDTFTTVDFAQTTQGCSPVVAIFID